VIEAFPLTYCREFQTSVKLNTKLPDRYQTPVEPSTNQHESITTAKHEMEIESQSLDTQFADYGTAAFHSTESEL